MVNLRHRRLVNLRHRRLVNHDIIKKENDPELVEGPKIMGKWYVYIAIARTGRYYVGITQDVESRIKRHNNKRGSKFGINQGPFRLVYKSISYDSKGYAHQRELQIKGWSCAKKEMLIKGKWV